MYFHEFNFSSQFPIFLSLFLLSATLFLFQVLSSRFLLDYNSVSIDPWFYSAVHVHCLLSSSLFAVYPMTYFLFPIPCFLTLSSVFCPHLGVWFLFILISYPIRCLFRLFIDLLPHSWSSVFPSCSKWTETHFFGHLWRVASGQFGYLTEVTKPKYKREGGWDIRDKPYWDRKSRRVGGGGGWRGAGNHSTFVEGCRESE